MAIDWKKYAGHELGLDEVRDMNRRNPDCWGWSNGMFIAGTDDFIAMRFMSGHTYEPVTRALWRAICKDAELVADVGTHSGVFTLDAWRAGAKMVLSAEPHPINYSRMVLNLRHNKFPCNGTFYGAIGEENKISTLLVKGGVIYCYAAGRVGIQNANGEELPVRVRRLDSLLPEELWPKLRAIKIDAENWTPHVLRGMGDILKYAPDIILESIVPGMDGILRPFGYKFWTIWEDGRIEETDNLDPHNPDNNYNGTHEHCRNRFASVRGLPDGADTTGL